MKRFMQIALCIVAGVLVSGCGPSMNVHNSTRIPVIATVTQGKHRETVEPSPGEHSTVDVDTGPFRAYAVPLKDWLAYAKLTQKVLNDSLADPSRLTGAQIDDIVRRLKDIADRIQEYEGAAGAGDGCSGYISDKEGQKIPYVDITIGAGGKLKVGCY